MRKITIGTIFYSIACNNVTSSTIFKIKKGTEAKETIKIILIHISMTDKIFAMTITKI